MRPLRVLGHPVHPVTVHVPFGLLACASALDLAALAGVERAAEPGLWALIGGLAAGGVAATAGLLDFAAIPRTHPGGRLALAHLALMGGALTAYGGALVARGSWPGTASGLLGLGLLLAGGWTGGEMVFGHGVGVREGGEGSE